MRHQFFGKPTPLSLNEIARKLGINQSLKEMQITDASPLGNALETHISFFHNSKYMDELKHTKASAILIEKQYAEYVPNGCTALFTNKPYRDFGLVLSLFYPKKESTGIISPLAAIDKTAQIGRNVTIGPFVVIEENAKVGDNSVIEAHTYIGRNVEIGNNAFVETHVTINHAIIQDEVFIKSGARIGQPGFGFHMDKNGHFDVPQLGCVRIGNNVHIGANTTIDRGSQSDTIIHDGVRIDNLVQIAHNVEVGENCVLVAQVGIAGSTKLGKFVIAAGQVGIAGHLNIGNFVKIAGQSGVTRHVTDHETVGGTPAQDVTDWHRQTIALKKLIKR
jgi:UDP-3-O-[3-hydroxymyristoyl] glucosamine N-acyltransferase